MAKIQFLYPRPRPNGAYAWDWKPSPRLARNGWKSRFLGDTDGKQPSADIVAAALELNRQVEDWDAGRPDNAPAPPPTRPRFCDLVTAYRASPAYRDDISASTRREYDVRLRQLEEWAVGPDGQPIFCDQLDRDMVVDLKDQLRAGGASAHKRSAIMRVLRLLLNWGKPRFVSFNATDGVPIETPPSRATKLDWRAAQDLAALAGDPAVELAIQVAFWSMQRREDLVKLNRFQWREFHGYDPRDLPFLAGLPGTATAGCVMGFRLQQKKTGRWVDCPMPPFLHAPIAEAFRQGQWLVPHPQDPAQPMTGEGLRRRIKPLLRAYGLPDHQLRDFRRSGMSWTKDMGALRSDVYAISGHPLDGQKKTMGDTYMPPDTRAACAAIAAAERTRRMIEQREEEAK